MLDTHSFKRRKKANAKDNKRKSKIHQYNRKRCTMVQKDSNITVIIYKLNKD